MSQKNYSKRKAAIKVADALNKIEDFPVTDYAHESSDKWAKMKLQEASLKWLLSLNIRKYN